MCCVNNIWMICFKTIQIMKQSMSYTNTKWVFAILWIFQNTLSIKWCKADKAKLPSKWIKTWHILCMHAASAHSLALRWWYRKKAIANRNISSSMQEPTVPPAIIPTGMISEINISTKVFRVEGQLRLLCYINLQRHCGI